MIGQSSLIKFSESEASMLPVHKRLRRAQFFLICASSRISSHIFFRRTVFFGERLRVLTVIHTIKELSAMLHINTEVGLLTTAAAAEACTARWLRLPPLCSGLLCGCERWRCLKRGLRLVFVRLSASPSFPSCSRLKTRNSTLRHVVQKRAVIINYI